MKFRFPLWLKTGIIFSVIATAIVIYSYRMILRNEPLMTLPDLVAQFAAFPMILVLLGASMTRDPPPDNEFLANLFFAAIVTILMYAAVGVIVGAIIGLFTRKETK